MQIQPLLFSLPIPFHYLTLLVYFEGYIKRNIHSVFHLININ